MSVELPIPQRIGYARVSSLSQNLDSQTDVLRNSGCCKIFEDKISGVTDSRPGWNSMLEYFREGDILVVTELSRMSRSLIHLLSLVKSLEKQNIKIISIRENIDTTTATGRFFINIIASISQMERELKSERAAAGRAAAKARGKTGGRPKIEQDILIRAKILYENSDKSASEICRIHGISRRTFFYFLATEKSLLKYITVSNQIVTGRQPLS